MQTGPVFQLGVPGKQDGRNGTSVANISLVSCKFGAKGENCKFEHPKKCFKFIIFGREERR